MHNSLNQKTPTGCQMAEGPFIRPHNVAFHLVFVSLSPVGFTGNLSLLENMFILLSPGDFSKWTDGGSYLLAQLLCFSPCVMGACSTLKGHEHELLHGLHAPADHDGKSAREEGRKGQVEWECVLLRVRFLKCLKGKEQQEMTCLPGYGPIFVSRPKNSRLDF